MISKALFCTATISLSALLASAAAAAPIVSGDSESGLGTFSGELTYSASSSTSGLLTIELTNTSPAANGGYITALAFNNPAGAISMVTLSSAPANFSLLAFGDGTVNGSPYGRFDIGASTGGSFNAGGNPNRGLDVGETGVFTFALTGTGLDALGEADFFSELSDGTGAGQGYQALIVRFRGFEDGGSDKVVGNPGEPPVDVPEPGALGLLGLGMLALAMRRKAFA